MRCGSCVPRLVLLCVAIAALVADPRAQQPSGLPSADAVKTAIERRLSSAPYGFEAMLPPLQTGVRVLDVRVDPVADDAARITIDLSQKTLTYDPAGDVDVLLDAVIASTARLTAGLASVDYRFLVEGLPLERFVASPAVPAGRAADAGLPRPMVVSAGHGRYWNPAYADWRLQRPYLWGIVEDFVNWDIANYLVNELQSSPWQTHVVRHPWRDAVTGPSGGPAWQDAALYYMKATGVPASVWQIGVDDYARDINTRPFYANWIDAVAVIAIHNNGGEGTGTETWFDATNGHEAESRRLADIVNRHLVNAIRREYNPAWTDRGLRSCNGCKGENRLASRPAIIVEIAFMDTRTPDNAALQDERFKQIAARAIRDGLYEWAGVTARPALLTHRP